jgi:hypothetical protein
MLVDSLFYIYLQNCIKNVTAQSGVFGIIRNVLFR